MSQRTEQTALDPERRQHYRVADYARVELRSITADAADLDQLFPPTERERLQHALCQLDEQIDRAIDSVAVELQTPLQLFADKLNLLAEAALQDRGSSEPVELSEAGITLFRAQPLDETAFIALRIQLLPEGSSLRCQATLIHQTEQDRQWQIGLAFKPLSDADSARLSRHLFRRQAQLRRDQQTTSDTD